MPNAVNLIKYIDMTPEMIVAVFETKDISFIDKVFSEIKANTKNLPSVTEEMILSVLSVPIRPMNFRNGVDEKLEYLKLLNEKVRDFLRLDIRY